MGSLDAKRRARIAESITTILTEEARASRCFVQLVFNEFQVDSFLCRRSSRCQGHIWIRADVRSGRTNGQKREILERIAADISAITGVAREEVSVYISDIDAAGDLELGHVLPQPCQESAWDQASGQAAEEVERSLSRGRPRCRPRFTQQRILDSQPPSRARTPFYSCRLLGNRSGDAAFLRHWRRCTTMQSCQ